MKILNNYNDSLNKIDVFSNKPIYKIYIIDRCYFKNGGKHIICSSSECIKWLSIFNMENIPYFPKTNTKFSKNNRMKCYMTAKDFYNEMMIKDYDLKKCLVKVWKDEYYRNNPYQIINYYYKLYNNQQPQRLTFTQLNFIIKDVMNKINKKYFI